MINRRVMSCDSCQAKIVVRTAVGRKEVQRHSFACPGCGVLISFDLLVDHRNTKLNYSTPVNARWTGSNDETGSIQTITFDSESMIPAGLPDLTSPFLINFSRFKNYIEYQRDEQLRRGWCSNAWPVVERLLIHYERSRLDLFDQEALRFRASGFNDWNSRLKWVLDLELRNFNSFTFAISSQHERVRQRLVLADSISSTLLDQLSLELKKTGRTDSLWREIKKIRKQFCENYSSIAPLVQVCLYWKEQPASWSDFSVSEKSFETLRQLYVDTFETLCRLTVLAVGVETIIEQRSDLSIPTKSGAMHIWAYEKIHNGNKPAQLAKYPISDLFSAAIDNKLRNGVGHHSAHYDPESDVVEIVTVGENGSLEQKKVHYTDFVWRVLQCFSTFELAVYYFDSLLLRSEGLDLPGAS